MAGDDRQRRAAPQSAPRRAEPARRWAALLAMALLVPAAGGCIVIEEQRRAPRDGSPSPSSAPEDAPTADPLRLEPASDGGPVGSLGWALLSPDVVEAVVEVDTAGDASLSAEAVAAMEASLREHGAKTVRRVPPETVPAQDRYTASDLRASREQHRSTHSGDGAASVYVLALPGSFERDGVPAVAFEATSFAVFVEEISSRLPPGANAAAFEAAVVVHELGHLFGLVNGTGVGGFHEDPDHPRHARDERSVMYWAVESPSLAEVFASGPPSDFTSDDRREMERIRDQGP